MALILRRLSLVLLALGAVLLPALRTTSMRPPSRAEEQYDRLLRTRRRLGVAAFRWAALSERDSGAVPAARLARVGEPPIVFRGFPAGSRSPVAEAIVTESWKAVGVTDSSVRVAVLVFSVEQYLSREVPSWPYAGASIVRGPSGGITCVGLVPGGMLPDRSIRVGKDELRRAISPCLMLAAFGPPGTALGAWLTNTRYASAGSTAWLDRPKSYVDGRASTPWIETYPARDAGPGAPSSLLLATSWARSVAELLAPPYFLGAPGLRCVAGHISSCRDNVVDTTWIASRTVGVPPDMVYSPGLLSPDSVAPFSTPRPAQAWWLSDLLRDQGRERFVRFWEAGGAFETAFRDSFGQDIGNWTRGWATRQWENAWWEYYHRQPRLLGVTLHVSWPLLALGWTGVALLAAAWTARRRQAT